MFQRSTERQAFNRQVNQNLIRNTSSLVPKKSWPETNIVSHCYYGLTSKEWGWERWVMGLATRRLSVDGRHMREAPRISANSREAQEYLARFCLPLAIAPSDFALPGVDLGRGTFSLIKTLERKVYITCFHVLQELTKSRKQFPSAKLIGFSSTPSGALVRFDEFEVIDKSQDCDIAVFKAPDTILEQCGKRFFDYADCCVDEPQIGEPIAVVGYPGIATKHQPFLADFGHTYLLLPISSVNERFIHVANTTGQRIWRDYAGGKTDDSFSLGGMSGGPAFVFRQEQLQFVGIVQQGDMSGLTGDIIISRMPHLLGDGRLDHAKMPF